MRFEKTLAIRRGMLQKLEGNLLQSPFGADDQPTMRGQFPQPVRSVAPRAFASDEMSVPPRAADTSASA